MNFFLTDNGSLRVICHQPRRDDRVLAVCGSVDEAFAVLRGEQAKRDARRAKWQTVRDVMLGLMLVGLIGFGSDLISDERIEAREQRVGR